MCVLICSLSNPGKKFIKRCGVGGGRSLIPYKERNERGGGKKKKKKLTRQRIRETIWLNPEREENKEIQKRCKKNRFKNICLNKPTTRIEKK